MTNLSSSILNMFLNAFSETKSKPSSTCKRLESTPTAASHFIPPAASRTIRPSSWTIKVCFIADSLTETNSIAFLTNLCHISLPPKSTFTTFNGKNGFALLN